MTAYNTWPGWRNVKKIGAGSFGTVYEIETQENGSVRKAALKVMSVPARPEDVQDIYDSGIATTQQDAETYINSQISSVSQECNVMAALRGNPNIVAFEDYMILPHEGWMGADILIRMELLTPLNHYMRYHAMSEQDIIKLGMDMCNALETCHAKVPPILHRDIKAANIMVDDSGCFKLGDFGVARVMEGTKSAHTKAGTEDHMAPEVMQMAGYRATADLYSLGIVLYRLLNNNRNPFLPVEGSVTANMQMQARGMRSSGVPVPPPYYGSPALKAAVLKALAYRPEDRYRSASEMRAALMRCLQDPGVPDYGAYDSGYNTGTVALQNSGYTAANNTGAGTDYIGAGAGNTGTVVLNEPAGGYAGYTGTQQISGNAANATVYDNAAGANTPSSGKKKPLIPILAGAAAILVIVAAVMLLGNRRGGSSTGSQTASAPQQSSSKTDSVVTDFDTIEILTDSLWILEGDTMRLRLVAGDWTLDGQSEGITWTSSDTSVARFGSGGVLEAVSPGSFTITAEFKGVTTTGEMTVVSVDEAYGAELSAEPESLSLNQGDGAQVKLTFGGNLPEPYGARAYDSAGMHLNIKWGSLENDTVQMDISDLYSEEKDGTITILLYDDADPDHVVAAYRLPVHIN